MATPHFPSIVGAVDDLKEVGLISDYAIGGSIALGFWDEPVNTFDIDIFVLVTPEPGLIVDMGPLHEWARDRGYPENRERSDHLVIGGIDVQFIPAPTELHKEAVRSAHTSDQGGLPVRVIRPEYLIAMWLMPGANSPTRKERASRLRHSVKVDQGLLDELLSRYKLSW